MLMTGIEGLKFAIYIFFRVDDFLIFHDLFSVLNVAVDGERRGGVDLAIVVQGRLIGG